MTTLTNINWDSELKLITDIENTNHSEESWFVSLQYNGLKLSVEISFQLQFEHVYDSGDRFTPPYSRYDILDTEVEIKNMYLESNDEFKTSVQNIVEIQNLLETDLSIQY